MTNANLRILVVDDDPFMRKLMVHLLGGLGFSSVESSDGGVAALELVCGPRPPELMLIDLEMPGMDGMELVRQLAENEYIGSVILVSAEDERVLLMVEYLAEAHHITVLGHARKPVNGRSLAEMIARWQPAGAPNAPLREYGAAELKAAISSGELVNYYQPKVSVATGAVCGVETLVRWQHPADGLVPPDRFIGVAEENGLINDLTRRVLEKAMRQQNAWRRVGLNVKVAVNLSMSSFSSVAFADLVSEVVAEAGVVPQDVVLEVTESRLLLDQRAPLEVLTRLRLKRFRLSIDDFGTGNSSLTQLRKIPFDELKVDRSFVHGASRDRTARAMYNASLGLGRQLGMEVVAEGVEDLDDWDLVRATKCDLAQGYFIARPMPGTDFSGWVTSSADRRSELVTVN